MSSWPIWTIPPRLVVSLLTVELTAAVLLLVGLANFDPAAPHQVRDAVIICLLGAAHVELAHQIERVRRRITEGNLHVNLSSVWFFAAVVLLHPFLIGICVVLVHTHMWWRSAGARTPAHRQVFSTANHVIACLAASAAMTSAMGGGAFLDQPALVQIPVLVVGMLVYTTINTALVAGAIAASDPQVKLHDVVGDWDENLLDAASLCLGALAAAALAINPWLALFVFPPLLVLHQSVLVRQLQVAASTDGKTGLLNAAAWHTQAERELRKAGRRTGPRAVLVIDLDHFKAVNDTHGHLAGDRVLAAVADALQGEVRDRDLVGRFGGEEFVVLLGGLGEPDSGPGELQAVAERIRERIARLRVEMPTADGPLTVAGLSASVGCARYPDDGEDLRTLLQVADTALYAAKRAGRNVVRMGIQLPTTQPLPTGTGHYAP